VLARDEESQATTQESMFNYVRLSDGGPARLEGPRSEVEVIADIAERALGPGAPLDFASMRQHRRIREAIGAVVPGYEAIGAIDETRREFHIAGRTFHEPRFATASGRARFRAVAIPAGDPGEGRFRLMTIRSEGQFNTVVYEEQDIYRGQERRDVILMNKDDIERLRLLEDQPVTVRSEVGSMSNILVREFDLPPGNAAMYYPEANVLIPREADPLSKTPRFKSVVVKVGAEA
jgi:anaerobic selenocysteine-containing dehydrogenase